MAASWIPNLNPINAFPDYHGPYHVGTVDVELPAADLPAPSVAPADAPSTVAFRIFYPCKSPADGEVSRPVRWIQQPQRLTMAALMKFLGLGERAAGWASYLPRHLYWIRLHAIRNAPLLEPPTSNGRWPVVLFSHGLAGSRNAYSYVCGDLASNGMIVIALDHRDGSSPVQYVRETSQTEARIISSVKISHEPGPEVYKARDKQLRIRLWEISMAYEALMKIDAGQEVENLDSNTSQQRKERVEVLWQFDGKLDIHRAGKVTFAGHSFGAATMTQLIKTIFYAAERPEDAGEPLIVANSDAAIVHQIMPESPVILLDMWGMPLQSPDQAFLWDKPLPAYTSGEAKANHILSILSEGFHNWKDNLNINKHIVAAPSASRRASAAPRLTREKGRLLPAWARLQDHSPSRDSGYHSQESGSAMRSIKRQASRGSGLTQYTQQTQQSLQFSLKSTSRSPTGRPQRSHMFFVERSQHFSQSDFGILFPVMARRFTKAEEPERILELNTRAMVQTLREADIEVVGDDDAEILDQEAGIRRWIPISIEDEASEALSAVTRKLSVTSAKSHGATTPRDGMTMGQKVEAQLQAI